NDVSKVSPLLATAGYLRYLRQCWDWHHPEHPLKDQYLILTVPASFGEDARQLTLQAAAIAGVPVARLLEEPTAAFYAWFWEHREHFSRMQGEKHVLVCDVGGGTSDFTLLKVTAQPNQVPSVERIAVGEDRKSTRLNSSHVKISYAVFCLKKKTNRYFKLCRSISVEKDISLW